MTNPVGRKSSKSGGVSQSHAEEDGGNYRQLYQPLCRRALNRTADVQKMNNGCMLRGHDPDSLDDACLFYQHLHHQRQRVETVYILVIADLLNSGTGYHANPVAQAHEAWD